MSRTLRFGVNYVPSKNWWYSWLDWDANSIRADLQAIAALNMDHIRIHCLWSYFQPNSRYVSQVVLDHLVELLNIADENNLDVQVSVLDGWLSGFTFNPPWQTGHNMFTDDDVIEAEKRLFSFLADRIGNHSRFLGFDLGNELGVLQQFGETVTMEEADRWQEAMLSHCQTIAPGKFHVNGVDHIHWFRDFGFSRQGLATTGSVTSLHTWIGFTGIVDRYGSTSTASLHLAEYNIELAKAYHSDLDRLVWIQEFGAPLGWMPVDYVPIFAEKTIQNAISCENVWGCTWWCSHDLPTYLGDFGEGEYTLGLLTTHNEPKPVGRAIAKLIQEFKVAPPIAFPRPVAIVLPDDLISSNPDNIWTLVDCFMQFIDRGIKPSIVLESRINDSSYLQSRGIQILQTLKEQKPITAFVR